MYATVRNFSWDWANNVGRKDKKSSAKSSRLIYGVQRSAILETLAFLSIMLVVDRLTGGNSRFVGMALHPFWIIVLVMTVQYGAAEALMAAIFSSLFLLVGNLPEQALTESLYDYYLRVTWLPFLWVTTALVLGSIRARQIGQKQALLERTRTSDAAMQTITANYEAMKQAKEHLEIKLAEERCSVMTLFKLARSLETLNKDEISQTAAKLMEAVFNPGKFSIFEWNGKDLRLKDAHGWNDADNYLDRFGGNTPLVHSIIKEKSRLNIITKEDEAVLDGQGILAGPIVDERTGQVFGMLKIEDMRFMDINPRTHELFRIVCEWLGHVYANVEQYRQTEQTTFPAFGMRNVIQSLQRI